MTPDRAWLASLKQGDEVVVRRQAHGSTMYRKATVTRLTKTHIVLDTGGRYYNADSARAGRRVGTAGDAWAADFLVPMTDDFKRAKEAGKLRRTIGLALPSLSLEQLRAIAGVIQS